MKKKSIDQLYTEIKELRMELLLRDAIIERIVDYLFNEEYAKTVEKEQNENIEQLLNPETVLACCLINQDLFDLSNKWLLTQDLNEKQMAVRVAMSFVLLDKKPIDMISVTECLLENKGLSKHCNPYELAKMTNSVTKKDADMLYNHFKQQINSELKTQKQQLQKKEHPTIKKHFK